jgi:DNA-binding Lrp family transcriptional regulator
MDLPENDDYCAIILMNLDPRIEAKVKEEVLTYPGVVEAYYITGPHDMFVKVEVSSLVEVQDLVFDKLRTLYGVRHTTTCFIAK